MLQPIINLRKVSSQHPCFPPCKVQTEKWTSGSIFKVVLCVFKRWPVSEGSWFWLWNAAAHCLLPTGDCKASVNTKILSFLLLLYLLICWHSRSAFIYIQSNTHTHRQTCHTHPVSMHLWLREPLFIWNTCSGMSRPWLQMAPALCNRAIRVFHFLPKELKGLPRVIKAKQGCIP